MASARAELEAAALADRPCGLNFIGRDLVRSALQAVFS
jgi:hypothetical protein